MSAKSGHGSGYYILFGLTVFNLAAFLTFAIYYFQADAKWDSNGQVQLLQCVIMLFYSP